MHNGQWGEKLSNGGDIMVSTHSSESRIQKRPVNNPQEALDPQTQKKKVLHE
jgi:hypothetical protein